jgi:hypothetical protein
LVGTQSLPSQFRDREAIGLLVGQIRHDKSLAGSKINFGIPALLYKIGQLAGFSSGVTIAAASPWKRRHNLARYEAGPVLPDRAAAASG